MQTNPEFPLYIAKSKLLYFKPNCEKRQQGKQSQQRDKALISDYHKNVACLSRIAGVGLFSS